MDSHELDELSSPEYIAKIARLRADHTECLVAQAFLRGQLKAKIEAIIDDNIKAPKLQKMIAAHCAKVGIDVEDYTEGLRAEALEKHGIGGDEQTTISGPLHPAVAAFREVIKS